MNKLLVSVSGGETSGYMAKWCKDNLSWLFDMKFIFANTGEEHPRTLEFVHQLDQEFHLNLIWVEADVHPKKGIGTKHKIVDYYTASRNGEPLRNIVRKYGIFNKSYPHCTRESKIQPINDWKMTNDWSDCYTAIGIRVDEMDRMAVDAETKRFIYPLVEFNPVNKQMVKQYWKDQSFKLGIPEHYGNCKTCWKKSDRKLKTIALEHPEWFTFNIDMEIKHGFDYPERSWKFFRGHKSSMDVLYSSTEGFKPFVDDRYPTMNGFIVLSDDDVSDGCDESCEVY